MQVRDPLWWLEFCRRRKCNADAHERKLLSGLFDCDESLIPFADCISASRSSVPFFQESGASPMLIEFDSDPNGIDTQLGVPFDSRLKLL